MKPNNMLLKNIVVFIVINNTIQVFIIFHHYKNIGKRFVINNLTYLMIFYKLKDNVLYYFLLNII